VAEATLSFLTQTFRPAYVPLYTSEKPPEEKGYSSVLRASLKSTCDDGSSVLVAQILWSLRRACSKVWPSRYISTTYDGFNEWRLELVRRGYLVQILNNPHYVVGLKALDAFVKSPPTENITQFVGKPGGCPIQLKQGLGVVVRCHELPLQQTAVGYVGVRNERWDSEARHLWSASAEGPRIYSALVLSCQANSRRTRQISESQLARSPWKRAETHNHTFLFALVRSGLTQRTA